MVSALLYVYVSLPVYNKSVVVRRGIISGGVEYVNTYHIVGSIGMSMQSPILRL
jgi:hypothetical protein